MTDVHSSWVISSHVFLDPNPSLQQELEQELEHEPEPEPEPEQSHSPSVQGGARCHVLDETCVNMLIVLGNNEHRRWSEKSPTDGTTLKKYMSVP